MVVILIIILYGNINWDIYNDNDNKYGDSNNGNTVIITIMVIM